MSRTYIQVINETLKDLMEKDPDIVLIGEDIGLYGGCFGVTNGLYQKFGDKRVMDTPMSEQSIVGVGIGAAMKGLKPIVEIMFMDFMTLTLDQLLNHAGIFAYLTEGKVSVPLVIRVAAGAGRGYGSSHSKILVSPLMHIPGIKIVAPSNAYDAGELLKLAINDKNPVIYIEHKLLYQQKEDGELKSSELKIGRANILREGDDAVIISYSKTILDCIEASKELAKEGISAGVIDLRTIKPVDMATITEAVEKTGKVLIVEEGYGECGVAAEIIARINEKCFYSLEAPPKRLTTIDVPFSCAKELESAMLPSVSNIVNSTKELLK